MSIRLGLVPAIVASSADAAEKFLKTYDHIFASRPHHEASQYVAYGQKNLIFARYGAYWRNMRILCTVHLLSNNKISSFQSMRKQEVELVIKSLKKEASDHVAVDLSVMITSLNANLTCLMVFGKKYMDDALDKRGFRAVAQDVVHLSAIPNLGDFYPFLGVIDLQGLIRLVVAQLVHCFDWEFPSGMQPCDLDIDEKFGIVTCREKSLIAIPSYRLNK